jgi:MoaA/NifB/PqqE/SkfB family radical SAM enzyme
MVRELSDLGVKFISLSGGEPFLREDLSEIVRFCRTKNIYVIIKSNGTLLREEFWKVQNANKIQLSLDGSRDVHDAIRGKGVYDKVIDAIIICKDNNIEVNITTVISKFNINVIPYVLEIAKRYEVVVNFQPVDKSLSGNSQKDIKSIFSVKEHNYKEGISLLIREKLKGNRFIGNSFEGLKYLYYWPSPRKIQCLATLTSCFIEPDGKIFICDMFKGYQKYLVKVEKSFKDSFDKLLLPFPCENCWSGVMAEFNLCGRLNPKMLLDLWRRF